MPHARALQSGFGAAITKLALSSAWKKTIVHSLEYLEHLSQPARRIFAGTSSGNRAPKLVRTRLSSSTSRSLSPLTRATLPPEASATSRKRYPGETPAAEGPWISSARRSAPAKITAETEE